MTKLEFQIPESDDTADQVPSYLLYGDLSKLEYNPSQLEHVSDLSEKEFKLLAEGIVLKYHRIFREVNQHTRRGGEDLSQFLERCTVTGLKEAKTIAIHEILGSLSDDSVDESGSFKQVNSTNDIHLDYDGSARWELTRAYSRDLVQDQLSGENNAKWYAEDIVSETPVFMPGLVGDFYVGAGGAVECLEMIGYIEKSIEKRKKLDKDTSHAEQSLSNKKLEYESIIQQISIAIEDRIQRGVGLRHTPLSPETVDRIIRTIYWL